MQSNIREVVKVAGVIDGPDLDGDGGGPLPDVLPVHAPEPGPALDVLQTLDPILALSTKPAEKILFFSQYLNVDFSEKAKLHGINID